MSATTAGRAGRAPHYDGATIAFHWWTAGMLVAMWILAQVIDLGPTRDDRIMIRSVHITLGVLLLALVAARIVWRATAGRRLPAADRGAIHILAKATHYGLYLLVATQLLSGIAYAFSRGDSIFGLFRLPKVVALSFDVEDVAGTIHGTTANLILALAGLHIAAALAHQFWWRDGTLRRMIAG